MTPHARTVVEGSWEITVIKISLSLDLSYRRHTIQKQTRPPYAGSPIAGRRRSKRKENDLELAVAPRSRRVRLPPPPRRARVSTKIQPRSHVALKRRRPFTRRYESLPPPKSEAVRFFPSWLLTPVVLACGLRFVNAAAYVTSRHVTS